MLRRDNTASFREDARLLAELLLKGGILLVIADAAGAPVARVLIQPDADILISINRSRLQDPELSVQLRDEQRAISVQLDAARRPLDAVWTGTHIVCAAAYLAMAQQAAASFRYWVVQTAVATGVALLGMLVASVLRRLLQRWLLRHL